MGKFIPWYRPIEMLNLGILGCAFFSKNGPMYKIIRSSDWGFDLSGLDLAKVSNNAPDYTMNQFATAGFVPVREMYLKMPKSYKELHRGGFLHWYLSYWSGNISAADGWRAAEWRDQIAVQAFYIMNAPGYNAGKWTDLTFQPGRRQRLLELGWDPSRNPANYGLKTTI